MFAELNKYFIVLFFIISRVLDNNIHESGRTGGRAHIHMYGGYVSKQ